MEIANKDLRAIMDGNGILESLKKMYGGLPDPGLRPKFSCYDRSGADETLIADDGACVDGGVNPRLHVIPDDCPKFFPFRIDLGAVQGDRDIVFIKTEVCKFRSGPKVAILTDN